MISSKLTDLILKDRLDNWPLDGTGLSDGNLSGSNLSHANLKFADLTGVNFLEVTELEGSLYGHNREISETMKQTLIK